MGIKITKPKAPPVSKQPEATKHPEPPKHPETISKGPTDVGERLAQHDEQHLASLEAHAEEDTAEEAPAPRPSPKTSPSACLGMTVLYRTQEKAKRFNGSDLHPAIITRVWERCVNLKVIPDCGAPYDATSQPRIAYSDVNSTGWCTVDEARLS